MTLTCSVDPSFHLDQLDPAEARRRMEEALRANAERPLFTGTAVSYSGAITNMDSNVNSSGRT